MNRTVVLAGFLSLVATVATAQPAFLSEVSADAVDPRGTEVSFGKVERETPRFSVSFAGGGEAAAPENASSLRLNLAALSQVISLSWSVAPQNSISLWQEQKETVKHRDWNIDWVGLLNEQAHIDATMHAKRLLEPKTHREVVVPNQFQGYVDGLKGYVDHGLRWNDGDGFLTNNINHPIMGATYSRIYTNHDRRCTAIAYGDPGYWGCVKRATIYAVLASANWEWNPMMSETAIGHVGKAHTCINGKCTGEGGWTDLVMTPMGGMGIRVAGDIARAKLWPKLDKHLSGNLGAKILKAAIKVVTDPSGMANAAFNLNFEGIMSPSTPGRR
jgi:hypothetical protein